MSKDEMRAIIRERLPDTADRFVVIGQDGPGSERFAVAFLEPLKGNFYRWIFEGTYSECREVMLTLNVELAFKTEKWPEIIA